MSVVLPNMGIELPDLGASHNTWDDKLNAGLALVDAHDHSPGKGTRIKTAGISIDADLPFNGFGATTVGRVALSEIAALSTGARTLFVNASDHELYWRTNGGTNVKVTSGSSLNISIAGGIGGDYAAVGAEVAYSDADKVYTFKQNGSPKPWARISSGPVRIHKFNATTALYVELAIDAALAAPYTLTFPAVLPAAAKAVQVSAAGIISYSNDFTGDISTTTKLNYGERAIAFDVLDIIFQNGGTGSLTTSGPSSTGYVLRSFDTDGGVGFVTLNGLSPGDRIKRVILEVEISTNNPPIIAVNSYAGTFVPDNISAPVSTNTLISANHRVIEYTLTTPLVVSRWQFSGTPSQPPMDLMTKLRIEADNSPTDIYNITVVVDSITAPAIRSI